MKCQLNQSRRNFISDQLVNDLRENTKSFWSHMMKLRKDDIGIADLKVGNKVISDSKEKAECLSDQFSSVFTREDTSSSTVPEMNTRDIPEIEASYNLPSRSTEITSKSFTKQSTWTRPAPSMDHQDCCGRTDTNFDWLIPNFSWYWESANTVERGKHIWHLQERETNPSRQITAPFLWPASYAKSWSI